MAAARAVKISPTGASLKNGLTKLWTASDSCASTCDGNVPDVSNAVVCCSGAVSHAASSLAASVFLPEAGTVRNEPPQLPPPPGNTFATSQPSTPPEFCSMGPVIQAGQSMVANASAWKPATQSSLHCSTPAESPSSTAAVSTWSYRSLTAVLDARSLGSPDSGSS